MSRMYQVMVGDAPAGMVKPVSDFDRAIHRASRLVEMLNLNWAGLRPIAPGFWRSRAGHTVTVEESH